MKTIPIQLPEAYYDVYKNTQRFKIVYGGAGSGKSYSLTQIEVIKLLTERHKLLVLRKVQRSLRMSCYALFKKILDEIGLPYQTNKVDMTFDFPNGSQIVMSGLDDVEKLKSIAGITRIFIEEATEITEEDFNQVNLRLRGIDLVNPSISLAFNPIDARHWIKRRFVDTQVENCLVLKTTYKDNPFIDEGYKAQLESLKDIDLNYYKIYALGEWGGDIKGLVYENWTFADAIPDFVERVFYGLDFGFSNDPTALIKMGVYQNDLYVEEVIYRTGLTNSDLISLLKQMDIPQWQPIFADSAEPMRIEEINRAGFSCFSARKGGDAKRSGIDAIKAMNLHVVSGSVNFEKEIRGYKFKQSKDGSITPVTVDFNDHAMDAFRYGFTGYLDGNNQGTHVGGGNIGYFRRTIGTIKGE
jgi:phage terminase large subunit